MNTKRYLLAVVAVLIAFQGMDFVIHNKILSETYAQLKSVWRPNMQEFMWMLPVIGIGFSALFTYFYVSWRRLGGIGEGLKYGLVVGLLIGVSGLMQYVVYPLPFSLAVKWLAFNVLECMVAGAIAAGIYQPAR